MNAIVFAALLSVEIARPRLLIVSQSKIEAVCNGKSELACTNYGETILECDCLEHGGKWALQAHARTDPHMYMISLRYMEHEVTHLADIYRSFEDYVAELEATEFPSADDCVARANEAIKQFPATMREFQRATTLLRDGKIRR